MSRHRVSRSLHLAPQLEHTLSIPPVSMLLPQVLRHLVGTTITRSVALGATRDWAEMKSLSGTVNGVLVAGTVRVALEASGTAELGAREARCS